MRFIAKLEPSEEIRNALQRHFQARNAWTRDHPEPALRQELMSALRSEQMGLCAYTEELLPDGGTIEHIRPRNPAGRGTDLQQTWNYYNMLLVRQVPGYGESQKGNQFIEALFLSPLSSADCELLQFWPNGEIGADAAPDRFTYTDSLLNLNHPKLKQGRATLWQQLEASVAGNLTPDDIRFWISLDSSGFYTQAYPSVVEAFLDTFDGSAE